MVTYLQSKKRQQGLTAGGWLLVLALIGFFALLVLRLFPIYSNNFKIKGIVETLEEEQDIFRMPRKDMLRIIDKRININFAKGFKPEHLVIKQLKSGNKEIHITYEDRRPILGNMDVVAKFDNYFVVTPAGKVKSGKALN
ncbi:MAG: DUF4845 domain-containing protein [Gammaproteobacteria bacterium]|nr:DUF4845 domain-containing protein [Gammaproteobacteria bacterium]